MTIHPEDLKLGLFVAIRFARAHPQDDVWAHVATPAVYRVIGVALPYVALECVVTKRRFPADVSVFEFEHLRPEFVHALYPEQTARTPQAARGGEQIDDRDEQGYPKPVRLATIKAYRD